MEIDQTKIKDPLVKIIYATIKDWLANKLPENEKIAFDLTPKTNALFWALVGRIKTMHENRGLELESVVSHRDQQARVKLAWGEREGTFPPHQAMSLANQIIEVTQASITDAFLFNFLIEQGMSQENAWVMMNSFREYRDKLPNLRTPQPEESGKTTDDAKHQD